MWSQEFEAIKQIIARYNITPGKVLEVGGGPIVVVDNKPQANSVLELSKTVTFLDAGFIGNYGKPHIVADFTKRESIMTIVGQFDTVLSFQTIEHVEDPFTFAQHMVEVVKPGGWIFLTTVFSFPYHPSPKDYWRFSPDALYLLFAGTDSVVIWAGWGPDAGGVMLFAQRHPSGLLPSQGISKFEGFIQL